MPFRSTAQQRFAFGTGQPWAKRWADETDFSKLPKRVRKKMRQMKDASPIAGAMLHGPGGLLATPGLGGRRWGNRKKAAACTCGVNVATKESLGPGITRIRGNLCNVHGRYGPCDGGAGGRKPKPKKGRAPAKPKVTPEQRAQARAAEQATNRSQVYSQLGLREDAAGALDDLRSGRPVDDDGGLVKMGLAEQADDGSYRLTPAGRALVAAASSGDPGRARDVLSAAQDRKNARTEREAAAAQRKLDAANRKAEAEAKRREREAERAKKQPAKGSGGKKGGSSTSGADREAERQATRQQRETERQEDRKRREDERQADRAKRQAEHDEDRAQRQRERAEDRAAQLEARRRSASVARSRTPVQMPSRRRRNATLAKKSAQAITIGSDGSLYLGGSFGIDTSMIAPWNGSHWAPAARRSFTVFKDHTDAYRWLARTTTAYRDRDGEIITTKALEADAQRMTATGQYGPLRYWHIGAPDPFSPVEPWGIGLDIGDCDYSIVIGRTSIESGTFKSAAIGRAFAEHAADYELSPGFFHPPDQPNRSGEYDAIRRFERSVVPVRYGRASNLFTGMTVKGERMDQATYDARVKAFLEDMNAKGVPESAAAAALSGMQQADKSAAQQGVAFKSEEQPAPQFIGQVFMTPDGTPGVIVNGQFVALKAAAPAAAEKAPMAPASMEEAGETEIEDALEEQADDGDAGGGEYIGDMTPAEFWAELQQYLAPVLKMQEMVKAITDMGGELKTMYSTKDAGVLAEIAALKAKLAELEGDAPAVAVPADVDAALKSGGPQAPVQPDTVEVPNDPDRPLAATTAALFPSLYGGAVQGYTGADGWRLGQLPQNTGGN